MGLYKRGKKWYCCIADSEGKLIRKSLSTDKRVAELILAEMRKQIELQKFGVLPKDIPEQQTEPHKTLETLRREFFDYLKFKGRSDGYFENFYYLWQHLVVAGKLVYLKEFTLKLVQAWAAEKLEEGLKGQTINQYVSSLRAFTGWCLAQGYCDVDPLAKWERLKESDKNFRRDLNVEEVEAIVRAEWDDEYRLRWLVYFATGLRNTAGAELSWEWIDWRQEILVLPIKSNKSKRELRLPLHPVLAAALKRWREKQGNPEAGGIFPKTSRKQLLMRFRRVCKAAGVDLRGVCIHSVRHTTATMLYKASGKNLKAVQEVLGHRNIATTALYLHVDDDLKRSAVENLGFSFGA